MIRELELLFQASRTSPMLHEAAVTVEEGIAALRSERDELVLQNERLGNDIVAAEAEVARLEQQTDMIDMFQHRAEAAEAREARLRDGLRQARNELVRIGQGRSKEIVELLDGLLAEDGAA